MLIKLVTETGESEKPLTTIHECSCLPIVRFLTWAQDCKEAMQVPRSLGEGNAEEKKRKKNREGDWTKNPETVFPKFIQLYEREMVQAQPSF